MNLFEAVKQNVTTRQVAELYGIHVNRHKAFNEKEAFLPGDEVRRLQRESADLQISNVKAVRDL